MNFILKYHEKNFYIPYGYWVSQDPEKKSTHFQKLNAHRGGHYIFLMLTLHGGKNMCSKAASNSPAKFQGLYVFPYILMYR